MFFIPQIWAVWNTNAAVHYDMQCIIIEEAFRSVNFESIKDNSLGQSVRSICSWRSNTFFSAGCELAVLKLLRLNNLPSLGNVNFDFLPNTIENLTISECEQKFQLNTRCLPREANRINLSRNRLFGSIDLTDLPQCLEVLDLGSNHLNGQISLTRLPCSMKKLLLKNNRFTQEVIWFQKLPPKLVRVELFGNRIQRVCSLDDDEDSSIDITRKIRL